MLIGRRSCHWMARRLGRRGTSTRIPGWCWMMGRSTLIILKEKEKNLSNFLRFVRITRNTTR
jgi:hypothetical protein